MRNSKQLVCFCLLLCVQLFFLQAEKNPRELSAELYHQFQDAGLSPAKQLLAGTASGDFPFNIIIDTHPGFFSERQNILILQICQEDIPPVFEQICELMKNAQQAKSRIQLVCTALDYPVLPEPEAVSLRGTTECISQIENPDTACALLFIPSDRMTETVKRSDTVEILPGAGRQAAPKWLLDMLPFGRVRSYLLLYRQNAITSNPRLASFLTNNIPAVGVIYNTDNPQQSQDFFAKLNSFILSFELPDNRTWDRHYDRVPLHSVEITILEKNQVRLFIIIITLSLFFLCGFSFFFGKNTYQNRKDFFHTWYLIPLTIIITALMLEAGQKCSQIILPESLSLYLFIIFKIVFAALLVTLFFIILLKLHLPVSQVIYGVIMSLTTTLNIFIFSSIDVSFVYLFTIEYIIATIAGYAKRFVPLVLSEIILVLPFVSYLQDIINYPNSKYLAQIANASFLGNILLACILLPILIMWLKIQIRITIFLKGKNISLKPLIFITAGTMAAVAVITSLYFSNPRFNITDVPQSHFLAIEENQNTEYTAEIQAAEDFFLELRTIQLSLSASLPIIRCDISVTSASGTPIYDSEYPVSVGRQQVSFLLPEYPPSPFHLAFTANETEDLSVTAVFYLEKDSTTAVKIQKELFIPGKTQA